MFLSMLTNENYCTGYYNYTRVEVDVTAEERLLSQKYLKVFRYTAHKYCRILKKYVTIGRWIFNPLIESFNPVRRRGCASIRQINVALLNGKPSAWKHEGRMWGFTPSHKVLCADGPYTNGSSNKIILYWDICHWITIRKWSVYSVIRLDGDTFIC